MPGNRFEGAYDDVDDAELVGAVLAGDARAERELYDRHVDRVFRLAFRMAGDETLAATRDSRGTGRHHDEWADDCEGGPVRVAMDLADGHIVAVRTYVGGRWRLAGDATDLGTVGVREAVDFLLDNVSRGSGSAAHEAIFPATIADSMVVWPRLLAIAKDEARERGVRKDAVFWVSQAAGEKATEGLVDVVGDAATDREVRLQAVFALSQRRGEAVAALISVARTSKDPQIRKQAIFWLGQSHDDRALEFFESVLLKK